MRAVLQPDVLPRQARRGSTSQETCRLHARRRWRGGVIGPAPPRDPLARPVDFAGNGPFRAAVPGAIRRARGRGVGNSDEIGSDAGGQAPELWCPTMQSRKAAPTVVAVGLALAVAMAAPAQATEPPRPPSGNWTVTGYGSVTGKNDTGSFVVNQASTEVSGLQVTPTTSDLNCSAEEVTVTSRLPLHVNVGRHDKVARWAFGDGSLEPRAVMVRRGSVDSTGMLYLVFSGSGKLARANLTTALPDCHVGFSAKPSAAPAPPLSGAGLFPAKLQVQRAGVRGGRLDVLARITGRATGSVNVSYRSSGTTTRFTTQIKNGTVRINRSLPSSQRRKSTGILTMTYAGNDRVRSDEVRLRAASGKALLKRTATRIDGNGRLQVAGTISKRAKGVVRVRLGYTTADESVKFLEYAAMIHNGRWSLTKALPTDAARSGGQLSIQYTGYEPRRIRGEQLAKAVTP